MPRPKIFSENSAKNGDWLLVIGDWQLVSRSIGCSPITNHHSPLPTRGEDSIEQQAEGPVGLSRRPDSRLLARLATRVAAAGRETRGLAAMLDGDVGELCHQGTKARRILDSGFTTYEWFVRLDDSRNRNSKMTNCKSLRAATQRRYSQGCHKEGMLEEHLNSQAFQASFSKARLKMYRESLHLPIIDNVKPTGKQKLSIEGKTAFLGPKSDMDDIVEAFAKVAKNTDKLT